MLKQLMWVFIGGGTGSMCRFLISRYALTFWKNPFPLGTFVVNMTGCLLIGLVVGWAQKHPSVSQHLSLLLVTGFCGGFTTFSSFANENFLLIKNQQALYFLAYTSLSVLVGFLAVGVGWWLTEKF